MKCLLFLMTSVLDFFVWTQVVWANDFFYGGTNPVGKVWAMLLWWADGRYWILGVVALYIILVVAMTVSLFLYRDTQDALD
jgi:hypothetical protein